MICVKNWATNAPVILLIFSADAKKAIPGEHFKTDINSTSLNNAKKGDCVSILQLPKDNSKIQLIRFGISEGDTVVCLERLPGGTIILQRNRQEIALGFDLAKNITVLIQ